jgi:hypothetical protein
MGEKYIFAAILIFLIACQPEVRTIPTSEYKTPVEGEIAQQTQDLCASVTCLAGKTCLEGECACPTGKKECGEDCIAENACCDDKDCESGSCVDGECVAAQECKLREELKKGKCACASGYYFCKDQNRCIASDDCCVHTECDTFERCVLTNYRTSFCIQSPDKKVCRIISDLNKTELFIVQDLEFRVQATDWWNDDTTTIAIDNQSIRLKANETHEFGNVTVYQEGIQIVGGYCKEDEDD